MLAAIPPALLMPSLLRAAAPGDRSFVFVVAEGGWDPTRVLLPAFDHPALAMEPAAAPGFAGVPFVDHPGRPEVRAFFERFGDRAAVVHGLLVPSVNHEVCTRLLFTGAPAGTEDWPSRIAVESAAPLPSLVIGGPSYPGRAVGSVVRAGEDGALQDLIDGEALEDADEPAEALSPLAERALDRYVLRRAEAEARAHAGAASELLFSRYRDAVAGARRLKDLHGVVDLAGGDPIGLCVRALAGGHSRCVTLSGGPSGGWDTHTENDRDQHPLWRSLFVDLSRLFALLESTPGPGGAALSSSTVVVVLSEMGRTPYLNGRAGKDHWPWTSALLWGDGVAGARVVGGYDAGGRGLSIERTTGEPWEGGDEPTAAHLGATLLGLAGADPALAGAPPIEALWA